MAKRNKKKNNKKFIKDNWYYILGGIIVLILLIITIYPFFNKNVSNNSAVTENINPELQKYRLDSIPEACRLPLSQDDIQSWKEHLSHHKNTWYCLDYFEGGKELIGK